MELTEGARVCFACGHLLSFPADNEKVDHKEIEASENIPKAEPASAPTSIPEPVSVTENEQNEKYDEGAVLSEWWHVFTNRLVRRGVIFALSLVLLLIAFIAPLSYSHMTDDISGEYKIGFTAVESVRLAVYSTKSYSNRQIQKTEEYTAYLRDAEKLTEFELLYDSPEREVLLKNIAKNNLYVSLMGRDVTLGFDIAVAAVASILLLVAASLFFIVALFSLSVEVIDAFFGIKLKVNPYKASLSFLWLFVGLLPVCGYAHSQLSFFGIGSKFSAFSAAGSSLGAGFVFLCIIGALCTVYSVLSFVVPSVRRFGFKMNSATKKAIGALCVTLLMLVSLLSPMIKIKLANPYRPDEQTALGISAAELFYTTGDDIIYYSQTSSTTNIDKINTTIVSVFYTEDASARTLLNDLVTGVRRMDNSMLYLTLQITVLVSLLLVGLLLWTLGRRYILSSNCSKSMNVLKLAVIVMCTAVSVVAVILSFIAKSAITNDLAYVMAISFAAAPIILFGSSVAMIFTFRASKKMYADPEYDNPDTSYAPYVIIARKKKRY